ncbi:MAG TPA: c-type cytochrome [Pyrinomonadaceae bacterium]|nr:c-type cytochrome [Pyrinomonadaceae bacterium]
MTMNNSLKLLVVAACLALPLPFIACGSSAGANVATNTGNSATVVGNAPTAVASPTPAGAADEMAASRELYKSNCAECHKETGKGGEAIVDGKKIDAKDLTTDKMAKRSDAKLADDISEGSPDDGMPAFKEKLKPAEIDQIVRYIRVEFQHASQNSNSK